MGTAFALSFDAGTLLKTWASAPLLIATGPAPDPMPEFRAASRSDLGVDLFEATSATLWYAPGARAIALWIDGPFTRVDAPLAAGPAPSSTPGNANAAGGNAKVPLNAFSRVTIGNATALVHESGLVLAWAAERVIIGNRAGVEASLGQTDSLQADSVFQAGHRAALHGLDGAALVATLVPASNPSLEAHLFGLESLGFALDEDWRGTLTAVGDAAALDAISVSGASLRMRVESALSALWPEPTENNVASLLRALMGAWRTRAMSALNALGVASRGPLPSRVGAQQLRFETQPLALRGSGDQATALASTVASLLAITAAAQLPSLASPRSTVVSNEFSRLQRLAAAVEAAVPALGCRLPPSARVTPPKPCCDDQTPVPCDPSAPAWDGATWKALGFRPPSPELFRYEFESGLAPNGQGFRIALESDADCDGEVVVLEQVGVASQASGRCLVQFSDVNELKERVGRNGD